MTDQPDATDGDGIRHEVRIRLGSIVATGDALRKECAEQGRAQLEELFESIRDAALSLRAPIDRRIALVGPGGEESDREIYALLFRLLNLAEDAKAKSGALGDHELQSKVEGIIGDANAVLDLTSPTGGEEPLGKTAGLPDSPQRIPASLDSPIPHSRLGRILVVDDNLFNRELLSRHIQRQGHEVTSVGEASAALELLRDGKYDLAIIDLMMPGMNGYQLLERIRSDESTRSIPAIVISAVEDSASIARCIQLGAEDYLPREFEPVILRARIESCLEKKRLKEEQEHYVAALVEAQDRLRAELRGGAAYVRSLLPPRIRTSELRTDWLFIPSASLGGDGFGYGGVGRQTLPLSGDCPPATDGRLALYLVDVSGHGIEAALFSVTILNLLKGRVLPGADFGAPETVLGQLASSFRMEEQNNLYFTAWYGVWEPATRELSFSSGGCPPALLIGPDGSAMRLETGGIALGMDAEAHYERGSVPIAPGSRLYLFSDGIYEFHGKAGGVFGLEAFIDIVAARATGSTSGSSALDAILRAVQSLSSGTRFEDDVSLLEFAFD